VGSASIGLVAGTGPPPIGRFASVALGATPMALSPEITQYAPLSSDAPGVVLSMIITAGPCVTRGAGIGSVSSFSSMDQPAMAAGPRP